MNTFFDTGVQVIAGQDYELEVYYDTALKPHYRINGVEYGPTFGIAGTSTTLIGPVVGIQLTAASPASQGDFDCRYVGVERFIG